MIYELKIKNILRELMNQRGETLKSLSISSGVPKSTISDWMSNRTPNPIQAARVAQHLGVSLHYLLFGNEDPKNEDPTVFQKNILSGVFEIEIKRIHKIKDF